MTGAPVKLVVPGLGGSGPGHWQSLWADGRPGWRRLAQRDWDAPLLAEWQDALEAAVRSIEAPVILVAHSLGSILVAHWARGGSTDRVAGALLVAPADVDEPGAVPDLRAFAPVPTPRLPFPAWVVASSDDPYCQLGRARTLADAWGARFVDAGAVGHLNVASGHGPWPRGEELLHEIANSAPAGRRPRRTG